ncbi:hypothetical protein [Palleronia abyssalis]|uniref:hypothetical protein n=1 Tax=Palleronia abyssalis TaxID=1501240 RepID=UPI000D556F56|nr:hypothetical protein [Palleronia abyssalis]
MSAAHPSLMMDNAPVILRKDHAHGRQEPKEETEIPEARAKSRNRAFGAAQAGERRQTLG